VEADSPIYVANSSRDTTSHDTTSRDATHLKHAFVANPVFMELARAQDPGVQARMRSKLVAEAKEPCDHKSCVFNSIVPFLKTPPNLVWQAHNEGIKTMLDPAKTFANLSSPCIVYGLGIATDASFEQVMSQYCEVHAFDCTIDSQAPAVAGKSFKFHRICLGPKTDISTTTYGIGKSNSTFIFQTLEETMDQLGHTKVDVLKFDIEGSEWSLLKTVLATPASHLPTQMFFELHTETANPVFVAETTVRGKRRPAVNKLFIDLIDLGYWVYEKMLNGGDVACADFSMIRLPSIGA
jgi:hypothetical protein